MFDQPGPRPARVAFLGWGSLLWDASPRFDGLHGKWESDGPELPLEFSRVSQRRAGALTLVIDPANGTPCRVAHSLSVRTDPEAAINDLRDREGTSHANIGFHVAASGVFRSRDEGILKMIRAWAAVKKLDAVAWTDLPANFEDHWFEPFGVGPALEYLETLEPDSRVEAARYLRSAPAFVATPLRRALETHPEFGGVPRA